MSELSIKPADSLARDKRIDCVCDEFEAAWLAGQSPKVQDYLDRAAEEDREALTKELIPLEIHYRHRHGEKVNISATHDLPQESASNVPVNVGSRTLSHIVGSTSSQVVTRFGTYEVLQEIARGGMGIVYKGRDTDLRRDVAVKVLLERHQSEAELIKRFVEEAQISGQLQHPGITPIYELGEFPDGRPYFAMKLVKGETLAKLLTARADPRDGRERFLKIFEQICQTLAYAHSRGVMHRDLKPANIMVGTFGEVQVMDWGLAKVLGEGGASQPPPPDGSVIRTARSDGVDDLTGSGSHTQFGSVLGTLAYMPPEQAMGEIDRLDQRADVFGLGAILCEILTGRPPYVAPNFEQLRRQAVRAELAEAFECLDRCGADEELARLARRTLSADAAQRPTDAGVLVTELIHYRERVETRLRDAELAEARATTRAIEERTRRKLTLFFLGAVLTVLVIGVIGTTWGLVKTGKALLAEAQAKERLRRDLYVSDLQLAGQMWESSYGNASKVSELLLGQIPFDGQPDLREFAWRLQWTALHRNAPALKGHEGGARLVAFAPDGQLLTLDDERRLRRWKLPAGIVVGDDRRLDATRVSSWSISADGRRVALGSGNKVHLFDTQTGEKVTLSGMALPLGIGFSADAQKLAVAWGDGRVQICDAATGQQRDSLVVQNPKQISLLQRIELAPDAKSVLLANYPENGQIAYLSVDQNEVLCSAEHRSTVYSVAIASNGKGRATGDSNGLVWLSTSASPDAEGSALRAHRGVVSALSFSADGSRLATGGVDGVVTVWDVASRTQLHSFQGHLGRIHDVRFAADGRTVASASEDGTTRLWNELSDRSSQLFGIHEQPVFSMAYSPDGTRLAVGIGSSSKTPGGIVKVWDMPSIRLVTAFHAAEERVLALAYSTDGRRLITGGYDSHVRVWDAETGSKLLELPGLIEDPPLHFRRSAIGTLAVSPNGTFVVAGFGHPTFYQSDHNQVAKVWELSTGREVATLEGHANTICEVTFSLDGRLLATASDDHQVKLWSTETWRPIGVGTMRGAEQMKCVAFFDEDRWLAAGDASGSVTIWEIATGRQVNQLRGHTDNVQRLAFSPDGRTLATASWDNTIKLWDPLSGREMRTLHDHTDWISCLAFSPDGNTLATGSFDTGVRLWEAAGMAKISSAVADERTRWNSRQASRRQEMQARTTREAQSMTRPQFESYTGAYEGGITIASETDHLTIRPIDGESGAPIMLYPSSPSEFFARDRDLDVTFLKDEAGQIVRVIIYQNGEAYEARRTIHSPTPRGQTPGQP